MKKDSNETEIKVEFEINGKKFKFCYFSGEQFSMAWNNMIKKAPTEFFPKIIDQLNENSKTKR